MAHSLEEVAKIEASSLDAPEEKANKILSFKHSMGFKYIKDIKTKYKLGKILG